MILPLDVITQHERFMQILIMNTIVLDACINGDLTTAEDLLTQEIGVHDGNYRSYTNRSVVMARKLDWDCALDDATKVRFHHYSFSID